MRGNPTAALLLVLSEATSIPDIPRTTLSPSFWLRATLLIKNSKPFVMWEQKAPQVKTTQVVSFLLAIKISYLLRIPKKQYVKAQSAYLLSISWLSVLFSSCPAIYFFFFIHKTVFGESAWCYSWLLLIFFWSTDSQLSWTCSELWSIEKKKSVTQRLSSSESNEHILK